MQWAVTYPNHSQRVKLNMYSNIVTNNLRLMSSSGYF